jgi:P4 family phage/plasmid primase-like protien
VTDDPNPDDPDYTPEAPAWLTEGNVLRLVQPGLRDPHREHLRLGSHIELRDKTLDLLQVTGPVVHSEGSFLRYQDGAFLPLTETDIYEDIAARDGAPVTDEETGKTKPLRLRHNDIMSVVSSLRMKQERPGFFERPVPGVAFRNGFVRVKLSGVSVEEHSPQHKARYCYSFDFEQADAPLGWLRFLQDVWRDEPDLSDRIDCLRQFIGLCLCGLATRYQKALFLQGDGGNGKSVVLEVLNASMPPGSVCSVSPQDMGDDYSRAMLSGKMLNIVAELPEQDILNNEAWKAVISGDLIKARHIRQAPFTFRSVAGNVYSANRLPGTQDHTKGFWRRVLVLTFNREFEGKTADKGLAKRLIRSELPAIVNWALEGVTDVMRSEVLTVPASSEVAIDLWRKDADQVALFVDECTTALEADDMGTERRVVYREYRNWCDRNGHRPVAINKFGQRLRSLRVGTTQETHGRRARYYLLRLIDSD